MKRSSQRRYLYHQPVTYNIRELTLSFSLPLSLLSVPYRLPPPFSTCLAQLLSAYAWKQHRTSALAATSLLQMKAWHSKTFMPDVLLMMAANRGGWWGFGVRAKGESRGRNRGVGVCRVFFSGTRTYLEKKKRIDYLHCYVPYVYSLLITDRLSG